MFVMSAVIATINSGVYICAAECRTNWIADIEWLLNIIPLSFNTRNVPTKCIFQCAHSYFSQPIALVLHTAETQKFYIPENLFSRYNLFTFYSRSYREGK